MAVVSQFTKFALHSHTITPVGNITPLAIGDLCVRTDTGVWYRATTLLNTSWVELPVGDINALAAMTWLLLDNNAASWTIGTSGLAAMLTFITTNGSEAITFGQGVLTNLHIGARDYAENTLTPTFLVQTNHPGGNASEAFTLPARVGGWRLVDAYIRSRGSTAGTAVLEDAAGGNDMTNTITVGAVNVRTSAGTLVQAQEDVASAASPAWTGASTPPAFDGFSLWVGL